MKLIFCPECHSIFNLTLVEKSCKCGKSSGSYMADLRTVEVSETSIVFCFNNSEFTDAIVNTKPTQRVGINFSAWVLPRLNRWIRRK